MTGYSLTSWHEGNGRPLGAVHAIARGRDGYLWVGTDAGLFRFDGWRFTAWDTLSDTSLPPSAVLAVCVSSEGTIWVGFDGGGIHRIRAEGGHFDSSPERGPPSASDIVEDRQGHLWAVGDGTLYRRGDSSWTAVDLPLEPGIPLSPLGIQGVVLQPYVNRQGDLWIGTRWGVFRKRSDETQFQKMSSRWVWGISQDAAGEIWTTDVVSGFRRLASAARPVRELQGTGYRLLHDRRDQLWIATFGKGLWLAQQDKGAGALKVERAGVATGLSTDSIMALSEDDEGNIWVGTTAGLHRLTPRELTPVGAFRDVLALEPATHGDVWAGTPDGVVRFKSESGGTLKEERIALAGHDVRALYDDGHGILWIGTTDGLWQWSGRGLTPVPIPGRPHMPVFSIHPNGDDGVWLGDGSWLFKWDGRQLSRLESESPAGPQRITLARVDSMGRLWTAFADGRIGVRDDAATSRAMDERNGPEHKTHDAVYAIVQGRNGDLWFGGTDGLTTLSGNRLTTLNPEQGLPEGRVLAIAEDDQGYLWLNMERGLLRMHASELSKAAANRSYRVRYRLYEALDGLAGPPIGLFGAARSDDGKMWFTRGGGLTVVDPTQLKQIDTGVPPVRIESVLADERRVDPAEGVSFAAGTRRLEISYTALTLTASHRIGFRYRLDGIDTNWVDAGTRRSALYTNLAPGEYRFKVEATAGNGRWDASNTSWAFTIQPAYYQTRWFFALSIGACAATLWLAWRLRLGFVRRQFSLVLAERARLSRELHDTLLQSLVGVALQLGAISGGIGSTNASLRDHLLRIRRHVEAYIAEAEQSIRNLRSPSLETRDLVTALNEFGADAVVMTDIVFQPSPLSPLPAYSKKVEAQLLRIGQEAITNAVRHAKAGRISLHVTANPDTVSLKVSDDGTGFDTQTVDPNPKQRFGLLTMKERAEEVGGRLRIATAIGVGTTVEVTIPTSLTQSTFIDSNHDAA